MKKSEITKAIKETLAEEKPGLWANIRAKKARGEKPAHKNSNAHKDAVKAGKEINAMSEDKTDAIRWFGNLKYYYQKAFAELKGEDRETYKQLAKDFFSTLEIDQKVRPVGLNEEGNQYDGIIGGIITRFHELKKYVNKKEPDAMEDLQKVLRAFEIFDEKMAYGTHMELEEGAGKSLEDLEMGEKFTFNGGEYTFIELYPELPNAARVVLPNGRKSVVSFGGGRVNTGKVTKYGPHSFGQGKGHHID